MTPTSVLFIHGTGVREVSYKESQAAISDGLNGLKRQVALSDCYLGAKLNAVGKSIPSFLATGGAPAATASQVETALWDTLAADPLYELRLLSLRGETQIPFGGVSAGDSLLQSVRGLSPPSNKVEGLLQKATAEVLFNSVATRLAADPVVIAAMQSAGDSPGQYRQAVARAIVASVAEQASTHRLYPALDFDKEVRTQLTDAIQDQLGGGRWHTCLAAACSRTRSIRQFRANSHQEYCRDISRDLHRRALRVNVRRPRSLTEIR
jgi:hypothetical protein